MENNQSNLPKYKYKPADNYCVVNEDDAALHRIFVPLPEPPPLETIDGYGLAPHEQKFVRQVMPPRLVEVVAQFDTIDEIWNELEENAAIYQEEIKWIKLQWYRRINGYWCFINGKPTFIDGWHYVYVNFWTFEDGAIIEYRDRNRKFFHAMRYAYTAKDFPEYDEQGFLTYKEEIVNGEIDRVPIMKSIGIRVFHGFTYPKNRRDGATNMVECAKYCETTIRRGVRSGLISLDGEHAYGLYSTISVVGWSGMPFFFKPIHDGFDKPEDAIKFFAPKKKGQLAKRQKALQSIIDFSSTAQSTKYDGKKLFWINCEECGKTTQADIVDRHDRLKKCIGQGGSINGFMAYPSTVGEMSGEGGLSYFSLCEQSHWQNRDENGQTTSGLMNIFFSSTEGLENFVDPFGMSVIEEPTKEQVLEARKYYNWENRFQYASRGYGSRMYLEVRRKSFLTAKNIPGYNNEVRMFPIKYGECFRGEDTDVGFNTAKLNDRADELKFTFRKLCRKGNFEWKDGIRDGTAIWVDEPENASVDQKGRWYLSKILPESETNKKYKDWVNRDGDYIEVFYPVNPRFTGSADEYKVDKKKKVSGTKMSDGGGAIFLDYDKIIDGGKNINDWTTNRLCCTYRNRPFSKDDYFEDMLMMCIYFGAMMYPENNLDDLIKYFDDRGYGGYLKYDTDVITGNFKSRPGFSSLEKSKQTLFSGIRDYIEKHIHRDPHLDFIMECQKIQGIDDMTNWDLLTAVGGAIMGSKSSYSKIIKMNTEKVDALSYFPMKVQK